MTPAEEQAYVRGVRAAWCEILHLCFGRLGYESSEVQAMSLAAEREAAIAQLRDVCGEFGDNDWPDDLHLGDVIEKHLAKHLWDRKSDDENRRFYNF